MYLQFFVLVPVGWLWPAAKHTHGCFFTSLPRGGKKITQARKLVNWDMWSLIDDGKWENKQSTENHSLPPHRQTNALSVSEQLLPWKLKKKNEIVLLLPQFFLQSITVYTMEYSFGQSWSAVMAVCLPKLMPTPYRTKHHTACYDES